MLSHPYLLELPDKIPSRVKSGLQLAIPEPFSNGAESCNPVLEGMAASQNIPPPPKSEPQRDLQ